MCRYTGQYLNLDLDIEVYQNLCFLEEQQQTDYLIDRSKSEKNIRTLKIIQNKKFNIIFLLSNDIF